MKHLLLCGIMAIGIMMVNSVSAETMSTSGTVTSTQNGMIEIKQGDGEVKTFKITPDTRYRQKKMTESTQASTENETQDDSYFEPIAEEDEWVEIYYMPNEDELIVEDIIIYAD